MKIIYQRYFIYSIFLLLLSILNPFSSNAAFPITENQKQATINQKIKDKIEAVKAKVREKSFDATQMEGPAKVKGDSGVFGLLGFAAAIGSIFCLAIILTAGSAPILLSTVLLFLSFSFVGFVLGIIGAGRNRKNKGYATAAIILTLVPVTLFLVSLLLSFLII